MKFRPAAAADAPALAVLRTRQLAEEGMASTRDITAELVEWYSSGIASGQLTVWVAEDEDRVVATAAVLFMHFPPSFKDPGGRRGYVNSMYTSPEHRGRGIATQLLDRLIGEAREHGVKRLWLGASRMGRPVYTKYGFRESDEWLELEI